MNWYLHWLELRFALLIISGFTVLYMVVFHFFGDPVDPLNTQEQVNYHLAKWILGAGFGTGWMVAVFGGSGLRNAWTERKLDGMTVPLTLPVSRASVLLWRLVLNSVIAGITILVVLLLMPVWHSDGWSVFDSTLSLNQLALLLAWSLLFAAGITIVYMILVLVFNLFFFWMAWLLVPVLLLPFLVNDLASAIAASDMDWGSYLVAFAAILLASRLPSVVSEKVEYA